MHTVRCLLLAVAASFVVAAPAGARGLDVDVIADELDNPRHVAVAKNGDVYVAEAGEGGNHATARSCFDTAEGFACTGRTGAITRISRHRQERVVDGLASFAPANGDSAIGPHGVFADGNDVYFTNGGPTGPTRGDPPQIVLRDPTLVSEEPISALYGRVFKLRRYGGIRPVADAWAFENMFNPDAAVGNDLVDSDPVDMLEDRGRFVIADAGGNSICGQPQGPPRGGQPVPQRPHATPRPSPACSSRCRRSRPASSRARTASTREPAHRVPVPVRRREGVSRRPRTGAFTTFASGFTTSWTSTSATTARCTYSRSTATRPRPPWTTGGLSTVSRRGTVRKVALPAGTLTAPGGIAVGRHGKLYV